MNPQAFVQKWKAASDLSERATRQSHFNDLCVLLGEPARGVGTVRYPRTVPKGAAGAAKLKTRTRRTSTTSGQP